MLDHEEIRLLRKILPPVVAPRMDAIVEGKFNRRTRRLWEASGRGDQSARDLKDLGLKLPIKRVIVGPGVREEERADRVRSMLCGHDFAGYLGFHCANLPKINSGASQTLIRRS